MLKKSKESGDYLNQIRNNTAEKVEIIENALNSGELPRNREGRIKIVELGTGGGESLRKLKASINDKPNAEVVAVDVLPGLASSLKKELDIEAVAADAGQLPFANDSISAINASAIIHEVSSYGTSDEAGRSLYGKDAVRQSFKEFNRILVPDGIVAYRDVLAPLESLQEIKAVRYREKSWRLFAEWFIEKFLESQLKMYDAASVTSETSDEGLVLSAPVGLQREFQRHYLMFRDYLRSSAQVAFGIRTSRSDWLNESEGLKSVTFSVDDSLAAIVASSAFEVHESANGKIYKGDSDQFDKLYDNAIAYRFDGSSDDDFEDVFERWRDREGSEYYLYGNIGDIVGLSIEASMKRDDSYVLIPEFPDDITIAPRYYYNRYLSQVIDNPEKDGKQIISFKKLSKGRAYQAIQNFKNSDQELINTKVLEELVLRLAN